jgi:hypothetical protein
MLEIQVFWDVTTCQWAISSKHFEEWYSLHLWVSCGLPNFEDERNMNMILQDMGNCSFSYTVSYPIRFVLSWQLMLFRVLMFVTVKNTVI